MEQFDKNFTNLWMPFTANRDFKSNPRVITKAEGVYYTNSKGDKLLDGSSGLFNTPLGHCRQEIADAMYKQLQELDYSPHFNTGHPLSAIATERIAKLLPDDINRIYFTNSGSETVDTTIKMIYTYWRARGQGQKTVLVSRERAYHGVNLGGVALAGIVNNKRFFNVSYPQVYHMRHTCLDENKFTRGLPEKGAELADDLLRAIAIHGAENIAACFIEPIAGGIGCLVPPKGYLKRLRKICTEHDILLVMDEVITGFARTGEWFASQSFDVEADIITMAKAITNGAIPMGAVATKQEIYDTVINSSDDNMIDFFHGYTTSCHPVACAACIATIDLMLEEKVDERVKNMSQYFEDAIFKLQDLPVVKDIRNYGMLATVELLPKDNKPSLRGTEAYQKLFWAGLHFKATGDNLIIAPAYVMEKEDIDRIIELLRQELSKMKP
ncbi:MAG: aminotransferase class III-fold pyridoxal phosphate-dependent enzyme [Candidatus Portiera sp.]|nr:aminotransferase class III-fold pyridoxal phosphate-dependent enzyme [Portiera sp.]